MSIRFCHISPTAYLEAFTQTNGAHLILAHLVEADEDYRNFYANLDDGKEKIMDNSAFEMYKAGRPMYPTEKLIEMGKQCRADMIVMSDYPNEPGSKTIEAARQTAQQYHDAGFKTFFVPQSKIGDLDDYLETMEWALKSTLVDRIGLSILGCPNAFGVERDNKLQRFMSRWKILSLMTERGMLRNTRSNVFHCLGMVDGPNEIELLAPWHHLIATWDSSAAVWAGINDIRFDDSPTGLVDGKYEREVNFDCNTPLTPSQISSTLYNINYIDNLAKELHI